MDKRWQNQANQSESGDSADKFEVEAVLGNEVVKVVSDGTPEGTVFHGNEVFWSRVMLHLIMGSTETIPGTRLHHRVDYTPLGLMAGMSAHGRDFLMFTKVPKEAQDFVQGMTKKQAEDQVF